MTIIGYARVSTIDQDLSIQETALTAAGCDVIRAEKRSGTTTAGREQLHIVLDFLRKGDRPPENASWTCSAYSPSLRPTSAASASLRGSLRQRPPASTKAGVPG